MEENKMYLPPSVPYYVLEDGTFEWLVQEHLGVEDYSCCADNEWANSSEHAYTSIKNDAQAQSHREMAQDIMQSKGYGPFYAFVPFLYELVCQGYLPEGNYLLEVV